MSRIVVGFALLLSLTACDALAGRYGVDASPFILEREPLQRGAAQEAWVIRLRRAKEPRFPVMTLPARTKVDVRWRDPGRLDLCVAGGAPAAAVTSLTLRTSDGAQRIDIRYAC